MIDMKPTVTPKSNQLNADDFIGGKTRTVKITKVAVVSNEQPVSISFEGDKGKPYKPCVSMTRVMIMIWGDNGEKYVGQSMTLYNDPTVKWAGKEVGGIRISHMTGLTEKRVMMLTATKGNKKPYIVEPLAIQQPADSGFSMSDSDWKTWRDKMEGAKTTEDINIIGQQIGEVSASYNSESRQKLKVYYADCLKTLKENEAA